MATTRLFSTLLRQRTFSPRRTLSLFNPIYPPPTTHDYAAHTFVSPSTASFRFFSSHSPESDLPHELNSVFNHDVNSVAKSELRNFGFTATDFLIEDSIFPVRAVVSLLGGYHDLTGFPWWIVIMSSTVALRIALLPMIVLQLQKLKQIAKALPK